MRFMRVVVDVELRIDALRSFTTLLAKDIREEYIMMVEDECGRIDISISDDDDDDLVDDDDCYDVDDNDDDDSGGKCHDRDERDIILDDDDNKDDDDVDDDDDKKDEDITAEVDFTVRRYFNFSFNSSIS